MKSHIIGFLLVTLAQIPMPIKIRTTFQNKLRPTGGTTCGVLPMLPQPLQQQRAAGEPQAVQEVC